MLLNTSKHHHFESSCFVFTLVDLFSPQSPALLYGRWPQMNLATRTFFLPETLHQLLSTNWIKVNTIVYKKTDEWYIEWQRVVQLVTTSGTTSDKEWQGVTTSHKEWQRVVQRVTTNVNEWPFQLIFLFFQIKEEPTTKHPKENFLNLEEDLWTRPTELRAETSTQK